MCGYDTGSYEKVEPLTIGSTVEARGESNHLLTASENDRQIFVDCLRPHLVHEISLSRMAMVFQRLVLPTELVLFSACSLD